MIDRITHILSLIEGAALRIRFFLKKRLIRLFLFYKNIPFAGFKNETFFLRIRKNTFNKCRRSVRLTPLD